MYIPSKLSMNRTWMTVTLFLIGVSVCGQRFDPEKLVNSEKEMVVQNVEELNNSQLAALDTIYSSAILKFKEVRQSNQGNRSTMRIEMLQIRKEKESALKQIFNQKQFETYQTLMAERRRSKN